MKKYLVIIITLISSISFSQNAAKAKQYLEDVSKNVKNYKNISIDFKYSLKNEAENIEQNTKGNVYLKGENYLLNLMGVTRLHDGKKSYTINSEDEEITITNSSDEDTEAITPSKMLTFYKEGYTYAWDKKLPIKGRSIQYIKLTPIDSNSEIKYVLLGIDTSTKNIYNLIENGKNGTVTTLTVNSFKTNQPLSESLFIFDRNKYSDYYINE
ncbi:MAG: LolA family protein [Flavobacteriaceae bacterium]